MTPTRKRTIRAVVLLGLVVLGVSVLVWRLSPRRRAPVVQHPPADGAAETATRRTASPAAPKPGPASAADGAGPDAAAEAIDPDEVLDRHGWPVLRPSFPDSGNILVVDVFCHPECQVV